jgi:hypothetical protein
MMVVVFAIKWSSVLLSAVSTINTSGDGDDLQPQPQHRAAITSHNTLFIFADDQRQSRLISASILVSFSRTKQKGKKSVQQQKKRESTSPFRTPHSKPPAVVIQRAI